MGGKNCPCPHGLRHFEGCAGAQHMYVCVYVCMYVCMYVCRMFCVILECGFAMQKWLCVRWYVYVCVCVSGFAH